MTERPRTTDDSGPGQPTTSPLHPHDKHDDMAGAVEPVEDRPDGDDSTEDQDETPGDAPDRGDPATPL